MTDTPAQSPSSGSAEQQLRALIAQQPRHFQAWYELGLLALRQGRYQEAADAFLQAADIDPEHALAQHQLGTCYQALGRREQAERHFHRVVCLKPEYAQAHNNWGIALAQLRRLPEASAAFAQALRIKPDFPEALNNAANALVEMGRLEEAVAHFRRALALHPNYAEAQHNLALALARLGRRHEALDHLDEAIRLSPSYADAHLHKGDLCRDLGLLEQAVACYKKVVELRPRQVEARQSLALALARQGQAEEAIACLHQCLLFQPDSAETYNHLGILLCQRDRLDEASAAFEQALRLKPDHAEALNNLGNTLLRQQKTEEAVRCFLRALELRQDYPQPYCNLASALLQQGKAQEAVERYQQALKLAPDYVDALFNVGNAYRSLGRHDDAVASYRRVLQLQPDNAAARLNLGVALSEQGKLDDASCALEELLRSKPDHADAHNSLGVTRLHQGRPAEALECFERGLTLKPEHPELHLNRALVWLGDGDYQRGWEEYEWRWKLKKAMAAPHPQPAWDGSALPGKTILLWSEQGLGDTLQFVRYASLVKERVGTVVLDCFGPLRGLLAGCPGIDALVAPGAEVPAPDVQAPLLSLPRLLGTTLQSIPGNVPYLFADASLRERFRQKIPQGRGLKVGLVWQGNPQFAGDRYRSVKLERLAPLSRVPGVRLFSLQKGAGSEQLEHLAGPWQITDLGSQISGDFRDTAAALVNLDLLVSVDTAVAHLAGALGVPVWILLPFTPDWRWLRQGESSPWYPSARLFRQASWGDWDDVIARVAQALGERASRPLAQHVTVELPLVELVERAVALELRGGAAEECWAALAQAGVPDTAEFAQLTERLQAALATLEQAENDMRRLESAPEPDGLAAQVLRRHLGARREREAALAELSACLNADGPAAALPPP